MCGIFGMVAWDREMPPPEHLRRVTNLLRHRGPDGGGCWEEPGVFFGHRRLSIIDLATGAQPMASPDGRYVVTFNGEIYNYPELRSELRTRGRAFVTSSDTEVILAAYEQWGVDAPTRMEGMFAFALYDRADRTLFLARDRFGEKPLLYVERDGRVAFASELAPLASLGVAGRDIDLDALGAYLCLNYVPGRRTMLRHVHRLGPAEWRLYGSTGLRSSGRYWSIPAVASAAMHHGGEQEMLDDLQTRIDHAVRLTLRSDVPVGVFLSGGVDSSVVTEAAARLGKLDTGFCVDFAAQGFSEWPRASAVARKLNLDLVRVPLDVDVLHEFLDVARHLDDPLADSSAMAVWTVARAARARLKVVLSGDGGDELFAGYLTYAASRWHGVLRPLLPRAAWSAIAQLGQRLPVNDRIKVGLDEKVRRFLRAMPLETREAHFTWNGTWLPEDAAALTASDAAGAAARHALARVASAHGLEARPTLHALQVADAEEYLPNDILAKVDRATMAHGLESRAPLLHPDVAGFALALPSSLRVGRDGTTKVALRKLCARHFGDVHAHTPKQGFSIPVHGWLRNQGRALVTALLAPERVAATGLLNPAAVGRIVTQHLAGKATYGWEIWGLMVLVAWFEERVSAPPDVRRLPDPTDLPTLAIPAGTY
jgi:asparagine synthase (glutamine-hydrolysing)